MCTSSVTARLTNLVTYLRPPSSASVLPKTVSRLFKQHWSDEDQAGGRRPNGSMSANHENKSYLSETFSAFSPWGTRSSTPKPGADQAKDGLGTDPAGAQRGGDHKVSHRHKLSLTDYPKDCPRLEVQWFHAVDVCILAESI